MITVGDYSLEVLRTDKSGFPLWSRDGFNYFRLPDGSAYILRLSNDGDRDTNMTITFDGKTTKKLRLSANSQSYLKSLEDFGPAFHFRNEESFEAWEGGHRPGASLNGLISVRFVPEKERAFLEEAVVQRAISLPTVKGFLGLPSSVSSGRHPPGGTLREAVSPGGSFSGRQSSPSSFASPEASRLGLQSGVTTFEGSSNQEFVPVRRIEEDPTQAKEIVTRLVVGPKQKSLFASQSSGGSEKISPWLIPPRID